MNGTTTISAADVGGSNTINSIALNVGFSVIQIAIGITVGLFLAALLVYPLGKRRSGLFSF
jgi:putative Ca2+/H+ antiporter (TMEM165/GDT1 family)